MCRHFGTVFAELTPVWTDGNRPFFATAWFDGCGDSPVLPAADYSLGRYWFVAVPGSETNKQHVCWFYVPIGLHLSLLVLSPAIIAIPKTPATLTFGSSSVIYLSSVGAGCWNVLTYHCYVPYSSVTPDVRAIRWLLF